MIDSHCHLADAAFADDLAEVVSRAGAAGVTGALCVVDVSEPDEAARVERVRALWPSIATTAGVHPHRAGLFEGRVTDVAAAVRARLAVDPGARAIGEVGLDYHYDFSPPPIQREVFALQVDLARALGLPLVIHTREADDDTIDILRAAGQGGVTGVFHCFSGDVPFARQALDLGFWVSFSGIVSFPKASAIHDAARFVPDDRLLVETDCPYLAPVPRRGARNEPAWVVDVARAVAALRRTDLSRLADSVSASYARLFRDRRSEPPEALPSLR